ncbi:MAG: ABC transporter permease [Candidatus Caldatribacterium sp.]|uniref:ABC transporter permease n=1 Tax=Candidatus Caldatribacterium sp. TaxID=2282143 RepID=UPI00299A3D68|nr:ABC transporter permease [Candidatus Caldatribacterium sp.]MCX7730537.1 ABC transporter permease [Candidatus Caldatribacterium sp.]MDW8081632.1 ABC transporter permease [Candidatus Calescibacterium sp.]
MLMFGDLYADRRFRISLWILLFLITLVILSFFSPYDPTRWLQVPRNRPPSWPYLLGTNSKGQDVFWEATFAIRNSLVVAIIAGVISRIIAVVIGMVAGYKGGLTDRALMSVSDGMLVIPLFLILVLLASLLRGRLNPGNLGLLLALFGWAWDARTIRSQVLSLREREFTYTALLSGMHTLRLVFREYLPLVMPLVLSTFIGNMAWAISLEVTLAILGLTNLDIPTLGTSLHWAMSYQALLLRRFWWVMTPVVLTVLLVSGLYWLSVSLSEYLDPRTRFQRIGAK